MIEIVRNDAPQKPYVLGDITFPPRPVDLGIIQMAMDTRVEENLHKAELLIREASQQLTGDKRVVMLPELFAHRYFPANPTVSVPQPELLAGPIAQRCADWAREMGIILVAGSIYEADALDSSVKYNTSLVFGPNGELLGVSRKAHIPNDPGFLEQQFFSQRPADQPIEVFDTSAGKIGVAICYDQWFSVVAMIMRIRGSEMIFYPSAIASVDSIEQQEGDWAEAWVLANRARAQEAHSIVAVANRTGCEGESNFWGRSLIIDAFGEKLVEGAADTEQILLSQVNLSHGKFIDAAWGFGNSERTELYKQLL